MKRILLASVFSRSFKGPREGGCVEGAGACGSYNVRRGRRAVGALSACAERPFQMIRVSSDTIQFSKRFLLMSLLFCCRPLSAAALSLLRFFLSQ